AAWGLSRDEEEEGLKLEGPATGLRYEFRFPEVDQLFQVLLFEKDGKVEELTVFTSAEGIYEYAVFDITEKGPAKRVGVRGPDSGAGFASTKLGTPTPKENILLHIGYEPPEDPSAASDFSSGTEVEDTRTGSIHRLRGAADSSDMKWHPFTFGD